MSEQREVDASPGGQTAGQLLRQAREAAGMHIAALAVSLKVPVRKLDALESNRLDELPDAVFARALASSVCRALRIDPQPVLALLPEGATTLVTQRDAGLNAPLRVAGEGPVPSIWSSVSRPAAVLVLLLVVGMAVLLAWPSAQLNRGTTRAVPPAAVVEPVQPTQPTPEASPVAVPAPAPAAASVPAQTQAQTVVPLPAPAPAPAPAAATAPSAAVTSSPVVTFSASAVSWVEVRDARGVVALQRTLQAGETVGAEGALPLNVIVGRADATRVQVRGRDLDLTARTRDNVARFEVR